MNLILKLFQLRLWVSQTSIAEFIKQKTFPKFLVIIDGRIIRFTRTSMTLKMPAVWSRLCFFKMRNFVDDLWFYFCDLVVELSLLTCGRFRFFTHSIEDYNYSIEIEIGQIDFRYSYYSPERKIANIFETAMNMKWFIFLLFLSSIINAFTAKEINYSLLYGL